MATKERNSVLESKIQSSWIKRYESLGYIVIRLLTTNKAGFPDIIVLKDSKVFFVEFKRKTGKLSELQSLRISELQKTGFETKIINYENRQ